MAMGKFVAVFALCTLVAIVSAEYVPKYNVIGCVYCDTCRCGYETDASPRIAGAKVQIVSKARDGESTGKVIAVGTTDSTGCYNIPVVGDHGDNMCNVELLSSPIAGCTQADPGRSVSRVILTNNNGLVSETRYANALGFLRFEPMAGCTQILKKYEESDE